MPNIQKGNINDLNNYRGISLIDVLNKHFTGILNDRVSRLKFFSFYKYMGILFTPKLVWTKTKENLAEKQIKRLLPSKFFKIS